jgi:hypothetical protein
MGGTGKWCPKISLAGSGLLASGFFQKPGPFFSDRLVLAFNGVAVTVWFLIGLAFAALPT